MLEEHAHTHDWASPDEGCCQRAVWMLEEHDATRSTVQLSATHALSDVVPSTCAGGRAAGGPLRRLTYCGHIRVDEWVPAAFV